MSLSLNRRYHYFALFWPLRWPFIFALSGSWFIYFLIRSSQIITSYSGEVLMLAGKIFFAFFLIMPLFLGVMLLGFYFIFKLRKSNPEIKWNSNCLEVTNLIQPFLGFVRIHLLKNETVCSESILLLPSSESNLFFFSGTMVSPPLTQSDIIRAEIMDGLVIHFEDPFRFFSFSIRRSLHLERLRLPDADAEATSWMTIKHPDREEQHTDTQQPRPGDWFRLKSFESGDDVRRIVWHLYARHKALMVRQQDQHQPYGDTLRVFVSFQVTTALPLDSTLLLFFETYYKQRLYALIGGLLQEGLLVDWRTNTLSWEKAITADSLAVLLANASFHSENNPRELTSSDSPSIVFISSIDDITHITSYSTLWPNAIVVFIDVKNALKPPTWFMRFKQLWVKPSYLTNTEMQFAWWRHPAKRQIEQHTESVKSILAQRTKEGGIYV